MAITTIGEAHAVFALARLLLPVDGDGDSDKARDALALLAKGAQARLQTGVSPKEVTGQWGRHLIIERITEVLYGDDTPSLLMDLAQARQFAVSFLHRPWFHAHVGRPVTDEEWDRLIPLLARFDGEIEKAWLPERFADEVLREAGIEKEAPDLSDLLADDIEANAEEDERRAADPGSADESEPEPEPEPEPAEESEEVDPPGDEEEMDVPPADDEAA
ncbi:hypothetical protein [Actinomadura litoris]|uniref:hypothetical protein n=1 Tax=Actinomadura litoris TaxID=2678616 RepID=UPI001FA72CB7|nr:hypothetical protein [Actinomadura litoris]